MRLEPGTRLGEYEVVSLLGSGGMGEVYRARDLRLRREVAIKVISAARSREAEAVARFRREAEAASALNHPHIVTVHGFGEATLPDGTEASYIVVELVDGKTLRELFGDSAVTRRDLLHYCTQVAEGLSKAHAAGIIHRDLKPDNIMVSSDGYAKIVDFGLAKLHEQPKPETNDSDTEKLQSQSGTIVGTLGYISPEQVRGRSADARSDIFSFGCILYAAVTRRRPFDRESHFDILSAIVYEDPAPLHQFWESAPWDIDRIVRRCLEKNPDERYQSARDLAIDLRDAVRHLDEERTTKRAVTPIRQWRKRTFIEIAVTVAILLAVLAGLLRSHPHPQPAAHRTIASLVILPFGNVSHDPDLDYLSDGVTDALLNDVSRIARLRVIARTTAFRYRNTTKELPAIGRELGVEGIVAGQVRRSGGRLLVDSELVDATDGTRIWGEHFERNAADMLAVEREIVAGLTHALRGDAPQSAAPHPQTENRDAYDLYLKGRYFWNKRNKESESKALALFQAALDADPTYARAYAGVSDCYIAFNQLGVAGRNESCLRGKAAAMKALSIDDSLPEAHTSLAYIDLSCDLDLPSAEREFRRALELSPNHAQAHHWYGLYLTNLGRAQEGLPHIREASRLDPFSTQIQANLAYATFYAGNPQEAVRLAQDALDLDRNAPYPYHMRGYIALASGDYPTAIAYLRQAVDRKVGVSLPFLAYAYARSGDTPAARRTLAEIERSESDAARTPALLAGTYAALGDKDRAFALLEKAYSERDFWLSEMAISPPFDPLRNDPRFAALLRRVGG